MVKIYTFASMDTKTKIIGKAKEVFQRKGYTGARMQEIADASGVNKALLHYHFNSKEDLFRAVLLGGLIEFFPILMGTLNSELGIREKIRSVVNLYIDHLAQNPGLAGFVLNELSQNPNFIPDNIQGLVSKPKRFIAQINEAASREEIAEIDPHQLIASLISLCVFPFVGSPMLKFMLDKNEQEFQQFIQERKDHVEALLINTLYHNQDKY